MEKKIGSSTLNVWHISLQQTGLQRMRRNGWHDSKTCQNENQKPCQLATEVKPTYQPEDSTYTKPEWTTSDSWSLSEEISKAFWTVSSWTDLLGERSAVIREQFTVCVPLYCHLFTWHHCTFLVLKNPRNRGTYHSVQNAFACKSLEIANCWIIFESIILNIVRQICNVTHRLGRATSDKTCNANICSQSPM